MVKPFLYITTSATVISLACECSIRPLQLVVLIMLWQCIFKLVFTVITNYSYSLFSSTIVQITSWALHSNTSTEHKNAKHFKILNFNFHNLKPTIKYQLEGQIQEFLKGGSRCLKKESGVQNRSQGFVFLIIHNARF